MKLYFASAVNTPSIVVSAGNRVQALRIASDYFGEVCGGKVPSACVRLDMPDNARVIAAGTAP